MTKKDAKSEEMRQMLDNIKMREQPLSSKEQFSPTMHVFRNLVIEDVSRGFIAIGNGEDRVIFDATEIRALRDWLNRVIPGNEPPVSQVDWLGLALDLEAQSKRVDTQTAERAMLAGARGLRLMGSASPPKVPMGLRECCQDFEHCQEHCITMLSALRGRIKNAAPTDDIVRDAERYRWLRVFANFSRVDELLNRADITSLDEAIDAARATATKAAVPTRQMTQPDAAGYSTFYDDPPKGDTP